jgi:hypothetical protein
MVPAHCVGQRNQECKKTSRIKCVSHVEKLELRFLHTKKIKTFGSVTHLFLGFAMVQNKFLSLKLNKKEGTSLKIFTL